jgi:hypothetical protein
MANSAQEKKCDIAVLNTLSEILLPLKSVIILQKKASTS